MSTGLSADALCGSIDAVTNKAQSCQGPANTINLVNVAIAVVGQGPIPDVTSRLRDIAATVQGIITNQPSGTKPFTAKSDQDAIFKSFKFFTQALQQLLNILIGKSNLASDFVPLVGPPLTQVLRLLEAVVDTLAFQVIDMVPDNAKDAVDLMNSLDQTFGVAIERWSGIIQAKL